MISYTINSLLVITIYPKDFRDRSMVKININYKFCQKMPF